MMNKEERQEYVKRKIDLKISIHSINKQLMNIVVMLDK